MRVRPWYHPPMEETGNLASVFAGAAKGPIPVDAGALGAALREAWERGRAAWPDVGVEASALARHIARVHEAGRDPVQAVRALHAEDLYLACGCAQGATPALAALEQRYLGQVRTFLGRMKPSAELVEEVTQTLRVKLLVAPPGGEPKIAEYSGRGALAGWLRVVAVRTAIDLQRAAKGAPDAGDEDEPAEDAVANDPELAFLKERYREEFSEAFRLALADLTSQQRNVLRLHLVDGLTIDQLSTVLRVHRSTAARWIASSREAVLARARGLLEERLRLPWAEVQSLARLLTSQLDLSLTRLLGPAGPRARRRPRPQPPPG